MTIIELIDKHAQGFGLLAFFAIIGITAAAEAWARSRRQ